METQWDCPYATCQLLWFYRILYSPDCRHQQWADSQNGIFLKPCRILKICPQHAKPSHPILHTVGFASAGHGKTQPEKPDPAIPCCQASFCYYNDASVVAFASRVIFWNLSVQPTNASRSSPPREAELRNGLLVPLCSDQGSSTRSTTGVSA